MLSAFSTRLAMFRSASLLARSKLIVTSNRWNLSRVERQLDDLPHRPITSLQANMTGCLVSASNFNNSALPPVSPFNCTLSELSRFTFIASLILDSLTERNPPVKWSTSSIRMSVFLSFSSGLKNNERCVAPLVAAFLIDAAFLASDAFNSITFHPIS